MPSAGFVGDQTADGEPVQGGTLTFADYSEARSLDPTLTIATGASGGAALAAIYDVLIRYDDAEGTSEPWLAESIEGDDDSTEWTLGLREGITFSDGTPLDAAAVVASINRYLEQDGSDAALLKAQLASIEAQDDRTVRFTLQQPWTLFPRMLAMGAGMITAPAASAAEEFVPIGAGPFELERYAPSEELMLASRPDYWRGAPPLDELRFITLNGGEAYVDVLNNGQADVINIRDAEDVQEVLDGDFPGHLSLLSLGSSMWINNREGFPGEDPRVRQALAYALGPDQIDERADNGLGMPTKSVFGPQSRWHTDVEPLATDPEKARELLDAAKADGYDGQLVYVGGARPKQERQALAIQAQLEAVGFAVQLDLQRTVADQIRRLYVEQDFDVAIGSSSVSEADPFHQLNDTVASDSFLNLNGYASPEMDAILARLQGAADDDERMEVIAEFEELWNTDVPAVNLASTSTLIAWQDDVHGIVPDAEYMMLFGEAWIG